MERISNDQTGGEGTRDRSLRPRSDGAQKCAGLYGHLASRRLSDFRSRSGTKRRGDSMDSQGLVMGKDGKLDHGGGLGQRQACRRRPDDVIIVTDQLHPALAGLSGHRLRGDQSAHSVTMNDFVAAPNQEHSAGARVQAGASLTIAHFSISAPIPFSRTPEPSPSAASSNCWTMPPIRSRRSTRASSPIPVRSISRRAAISRVSPASPIRNDRAQKAGTLNVLVDIANTDGVTGGNINVDSGAKLVLGTDANNAGTHGGVAEGTVTVNSGGELISRQQRPG